MLIHDAENLGALVRMTRKAQKLTQEQLAAQSSVGVRFLRELESGKPGCHVGKMFQVLAMLGLEMRIEARNVLGGSGDGAGFGDGDGAGAGSGRGSGDGSGKG